MESSRKAFPSFSSSGRAPRAGTSIASVGMIVGLPVMALMLMVVRPVVIFGGMVMGLGILSAGNGMRVLVRVLMGVNVRMRMDVGFVPVGMRVLVFVGVFVPVAVVVFVFARRDPLLEQNFMIHQGHPLDPALDGDLIPENADEAEAALAVGLHHIHGFHDQPFLSILNDIGVGFTHGLIPPLIFPPRRSGPGGAGVP